MIAKGTNKIDNAVNAIQKSKILLKKFLYFRCTSKDMEPIFLLHFPP